MSLLLSLINYLVDNGVIAGDGVDAFRDFTPESPDFAVIFHEYRGDPVTVFTDNVHRSVQVKVRANSAEEARAKAVDICRALKPTTEDLRVDFSDTLWGQVYIRQTPFKLDQDKSNRVIYCFNLGITTNILE